MSFFPVPAAPCDEILDQALADPKRLEGIAASGLLDPDTTSVFDRLTRVACLLMQTPVSFFSVPLPEHDVYVSEWGLDEPLATERRQAGRTFCHYVVESEAPLVLNDTLAFPGYREVPTMQSLGVRAYVGIPISVDNTAPLGSLCVIDFQPRQWTDQQLAALQELATSASRELSLRAALRQIKVEREEAWQSVSNYEAMLASVAHDLRGVISNVYLSAQIVERSRDLAESQNIARQIANAAEHMTAVTNDLLRHRRQTHAHVSDPPVIQVQRILIAASDLLAQQASQRGIDIVISSPHTGEMHVLAPQSDALRILGNLIGNAIGVGHPGGRIMLSAEAVPQSMVRFTVDDDGPGFESTMAEAIFEPGVQLLRQRSGMAGLGLSIARDLVLAHGGTIGAISAPGEGARFWFTLPRYE